LLLHILAGFIAALHNHYNEHVAEQWQVAGPTVLEHVERRPADFGGKILILTRFATGKAEVDRTLKT
jgi:hypothetical protein